MPPFIFLGLILLILLWMLCTWIDERGDCDVPTTPLVMEMERDAGDSGEMPLFQQKDGTLNKSFPYSSLKRQPKIRDQKSALDSPKMTNLRFGASSQEDHPHEHTEYPPEAPEALRPRRVVLARPPKEEEDEPEVKKSAAVQTDEIPEPVCIKAPQSSSGTQKNVETEECSSQTYTPPLRTSWGVQAGVEQEDVGVEVLPHVNSRGSQAGVATQDAEVQTEEALVPKVASHPSSEEEPEDSFESYPLKPKYLSSFWQSEDEESELSSNARRERYSIIQPFMPSWKESEDEE